MTATASSMPCWARRAASGPLLVCTLLTLVGCGMLGTEAPGRVSVLGLGSGADDATEVSMEVELGAAHYAALHSGLSMSLHWEVQLIEPGSLWSRTLWQTEGNRIIGYRGLLQQYTLLDRQATAPPTSRRFASAAALEQALARVAIDQLPPVAAGQQLRFRLRLDTESLPPPMRLPARINPIWWLDSNWEAVEPSGQPSGKPSGQRRGGV